MLGHLRHRAINRKPLITVLARNEASMRNARINSLLNDLHVQRYSDVFQDPTLSYEARTPMRFCLLTRRSTPRSTLTKLVQLPHENGSYTVTPEHAVRKKGYSPVNTVYIATAYNNYVKNVVHKALTDGSVPCSVPVDIQEIINDSTRCKTLDVLCQVLRDRNSYIVNPSREDILNNQAEQLAVIATKDADPAFQASYLAGLPINGKQTVFFPPSLSMKTTAVQPLGSRALKLIRTLPKTQGIAIKYRGVGAPADVTSQSVLAAFPNRFHDTKHFAKLAQREFIENRTMDKNNLVLWTAAQRMREKRSSTTSSTAAVPLVFRAGAGSVQVVPVGSTYMLPFETHSQITALPPVLHSHDIVAAFREAGVPISTGIAALALKRSVPSNELTSLLWALYMLETPAQNSDVAKFIGQANHS